MNQAHVTEEWTRIFPRQVTKTYTSSVTFMKQLTTVAVSTITNVRGVFDEVNYNIEKFGGLTLNILKNKCSDEVAQFVSTSLAGAFEAFDKKYLHKLALCFYEDGGGLLEYYMFKYTYSSDGVSVDFQSSRRDRVQHSTRFAFDNVRAQIWNLFQTCVVVAKDLSSLPSTFNISLQLYYNDEAPLGYQAPGFAPASAADDPVALTTGDCYAIGCVETPFHSILATSYTRERLPSSHTANASENAPVMTQDEVEDFYPVGVSEAMANGRSDQRHVRCPCNKTDQTRQVALLTCDYCNTAQHAACFGVRRAAAARRARHCCTHCSDADPARIPTDPKLISLATKEREHLCVFRRTLEWCESAREASVKSLMARFCLQRGPAANLMRLLKRYGLFQQDGSDLDSPLTIVPERVNIVINKHFQAMELDMVDRLVAESLSQESLADPVGEALGPMDTASLQHATAVGKIIEHTPPCVVEDPTLKQYREALQSTDQAMDEELPLSGSHNPVKDMQNIGKTTKRKMNDQDTRRLRSRKKTKRSEGF